MTQTQPETVVEQTERGRTRWGVFLAILAVPTLVVAAPIALLVAWLFTDDSVEADVKKTSCAEALAYGGAKLPTGAYDTLCVVRAGQESRYEATFRAPRDGVDDWLAATYPDAPAPRAERCATEQTDLCLSLGAGEVPGRDAVVQVEITYDGPKWSQVRFVASAG
ncbi:hypothetical protein ABZ896_34755 [Streptomyces sp. NPDC047072]|uniref:hypothetical protein n=1 Tax=Streptomyces sp. NPDC047072 TaxID=3154809 RepID=UPI0033FB50AE